MPHFFRYRHGERTALKTLAEARVANFRNLFEDTHLAYDHSAKKKLVGKLILRIRSLVSRSQDLHQAARGPAPAPAAAPPAATLREFLAGGLNGETSAELFSELAAEVTPIVGAVFSSYKAMSSWKNLCRTLQESEHAEDHGTRMAVAGGDPELAHAALLTLLDRQVGRYTTDGVRQSAAASAKIAGLVADIGLVTGPAIGLANSLAAIAITLGRLATDLREMRAGNAFLQNPDTLLTGHQDIFEACPLLGCYYLTCSDTSNVIQFYQTDLVDPNLKDGPNGGFKGRIEDLKANKIDPLLKAATRVIEHAPVKLLGLKADKGVGEKMLQKNGLNPTSRLTKVRQALHLA